SNINTPGYTRQRVDMYSMYVSGLGEARWSSRSNMLSMQGQGANAYGVSQIRDIYIDKRYRENVSIEAETDKKIDILGDIEDILDNFETDGLQTKTKDLWAALQDYSEEKPDSTEVATIVVNAAVNLCRLLNDYSTQLKQVEDTYVNELRDNVDYVNKLLAEMNVLNDRIEKEKFHYAEQYGPNELYDHMNLYIDELATYGEIVVHQNTNGTFNVSMGGVTILDGEKNKYSHIIMKDYELYGAAELYFENGQDVLLTRGILKGYQDMINGNGVYAAGGQNNSYGIAYFKSAINVYARTVAEVLNTANGANEDSSRAMFVPAIDDALITAGNIRVSDSWREDPTMIGKVRYFNEKTGMFEYGFDERSDTPITTIKYKKEIVYEKDADGKDVLDKDGNKVPVKNPNGSLKYDYVFDENGKPVPETDANGNIVYETVDNSASGIVNLQNTNVKYLFSQFDNKAITFGNCHDFSGSFFEYVAFVSNRLGQTIEYEVSRNETAIVTVDELLDARDAVSGVEMDEEGINMLNYTKWYNASSRMLTTLDDMLDRLINGTGRVGL
ncbi:MAG: hypothetical protein K2J80_09895, partial [Oscillospiraceae bacterium]|nr:hypothetical protein [Oscillospiraceae bacterium]